MENIGMELLDILCWSTIALSVGFMFYALIKTRIKNKEKQ